MEVPPPSGRLLTQHTQFRVRRRSERGVRLQAPPCAAYEAQLRHPSDYRDCQRLGSALRESGVGAFELVSARDPERGINVALLGPEALTSRAPLGVRAWLCETRADRILFVSEDEPELHVLAFDLFTIDGGSRRVEDCAVACHRETARQSDVQSRAHVGLRISDPLGDHQGQVAQTAFGCGESAFGSVGAFGEVGWGMD